MRFSYLKNHLFSDTFFSIFTRVLVVLAGIATSILTARILGVEGRGQYFYIVTLANFAMQFGHLGFASSNTYLLAKDQSLLSRLAANSFWIGLVVGLLAIGSLLFFDHLVNKRIFTTTAICAALLMTPSLLYALLANGLLVGLSRIKEFNYFQIGSTLFLFIALFFTAFIDGKVGAFLIASGVANMAIAMLLFTRLRALGKPQWSFDTAVFKTGMGFAGRAYMCGLLEYCFNRGGVVLLGYYSTEAEIGIYSVALQFVEALIMVPNIIAMILFPQLVKATPQEQYHLTMKNLRVMALSMGALCIATAVAAIWVIPWFFGFQFSGALPVLWWMLPGVFSTSLFRMISQYMGAQGIPLGYIGIEFFGIIILGISGHFLMPHWGALGAGVSLSAVYLTLFVSILLLARYKHNFKREL